MTWLIALQCNSLKIKSLSVVLGTWALIYLLVGYNSSLKIMSGEKVKEKMRIFLSKIIYWFLNKSLELQKSIIIKA